MKVRATKQKNGTRPVSQNGEKDVTSPNYIAVLAILNTIVQRVSSSWPDIREATQKLPSSGAILDTDDKLLGVPLPGDY